MRVVCCLASCKCFRPSAPKNLSAIRSQSVIDSEPVLKQTCPACSPPIGPSPEYSPASNDLSNKEKSVGDYIPKGNLKAEEAERMLDLENSLLAGDRKSTRLTSSH